jgi:hypothetical protein
MPRPPDAAPPRQGTGASVNAYKGRQPEDTLLDDDDRDGTLIPVAVLVRLLALDLRRRCRR